MSDKVASGYRPNDSEQFGVSPIEAHELPPRPYLPPLLWACLSLIVCARTTLGKGSVSIETLGAICIVAVGCGLPLILTFRSKMGKGESIIASSLGLTLAFIFVSALFGALLANQLLESERSTAAILSSRESAECEMNVTTDPSPSRSGWTCTCTIRAPPGCKGKVVATIPGRLSKNGMCPLNRGDQARCLATFEPAQDDDWGSSLRMRGCAGSLRVERIDSACKDTGPIGFLLSARELCADVIGVRDGGAPSLIGGCVLGIREGMKVDGSDELFAVCGLSHLIAVSGCHLAVIAAVLNRMLRTLPSKKRRVTCAVLLGLFVALSGMAPSAVRAWIMCVLAFGAEGAGRRAHSLSAVCLAAMVMAILNIGVVGELGYLLSVTSVVGLCLFSRWCGYAVNVLLIGPRLIKNKSLVRKASPHLSTLSASLVCQACTLPLTAPLFGTISLIGPLANLLTAFLLPPVIGAGLLACLLGWIPVLGGAVVKLALMPAYVLLAIVKVLACLPAASVTYDGDETGLAVAVMGFGILILALWPRVSRKGILSCTLIMMLALAGLYVRYRYFSEPRIVILDVGQGDAILVQDGASALLVDAGPDESLSAALSRQHVFHLDGVVLTHQHDDHYGGLQSLKGGPKVEETYVAEGVARKLSHEASDAISCVDQNGPQEVKEGDTLVVGGFCLKVVWPNDEVDGTQNEQSLCLEVTYRDGAEELHGLLTGDAESEVLERLLETGKVGDLDWLKVGHHGSKVSVTREQAEELRAELSVASAGDANRYGHPSRECRETLEGTGSLFVCTKDYGDVTIRPRDGMTVSFGRGNDGEGAQRQAREGGGRQTGARAYRET